MGQSGSKRFKYGSSTAAKLLENCIQSEDNNNLTSLLGQVKVDDLNKFHLLHYAVKHGNAECVRILLDRGVDVNLVVPKTGMTPLHYACTAQEGSDKCIQMLLKFGARLDSFGKCKKSALHMAIECSNMAAAETLMEYGSSVNLVSECDNGISPFLLACKQDDAQLVKFLLIAGADMRSCYIWKTTLTPPLDIVTYKMSKETLPKESSRDLLKVILKGDGNLPLTLCQMPQAQQTRVTAVRTHKSIKTIIDRLSNTYSNEIIEFLELLVYSGFKLQGDNIALLEGQGLSSVLFDLRTHAPLPLTYICVKAVRKRLKHNVYYGNRLLNLPKHIQVLITLKVFKFRDLCKRESRFH